MILLRYDQPFPPILKQINDSHPFPFLECFHAYERAVGNDTGILWDEKMDIMVPIRIYRKKPFLFSQFLFNPIREGQRLNPEEEQLFISNAVEFLKSHERVQRILQSPPMNTFYNSPPGSTSCPFGVYFVDLEKSESEIFQKIQSRTRRYIRKVSEENSLEIREGEMCLNDFYLLHVSTMKRENAYHEPLDKMKKFVTFLSPKNILCLVAYRNQIAEAGLLIPYSLYQGVLFYGGEANSETAGVSNKWLHWEAMLKLKERKVKKLILGGSRRGNIGGTKYEGIQFFKERLGPELELGVLWKMDLHPVFTHVYDSLLKLRQLLSVKKNHPDIIDFYHQRNPRF